MPPIKTSSRANRGGWLVHDRCHFCALHCEFRSSSCPLLLSHELQAPLPLHLGDTRGFTRFSTNLSTHPLREKTCINNFNFLNQPLICTSKNNVSIICTTEILLFVKVAEPLLSLLFRGDHRERRRESWQKWKISESIGRDRQRSSISSVGGGGFLPVEDWDDLARRSTISTGVLRRKGSVVTVGTGRINQLHETLEERGGGVWRAGRPGRR